MPAFKITSDVHARTIEAIQSNHAISLIKLSMSQHVIQFCLQYHGMLLTNEFGISQPFAQLGLGTSCKTTEQPCTSSIPRHVRRLRCTERSSHCRINYSPNAFAVPRTHTQLIDAPRQSILAIVQPECSRQSVQKGQMDLSDADTLPQIQQFSTMSSGTFPCSDWAVLEALHARSWRHVWFAPTF